MISSNLACHICVFAGETDGSCVVVVVCLCIFRFPALVFDRVWNYWENTVDWKEAQKRHTVDRQDDDDSFVRFVNAVDSHLSIRHSEKHQLIVFRIGMRVAHATHAHTYVYTEFCEWNCANETQEQ